MGKHITAVAALNIASGALGLLLALIVFVAIVGGGLLSQDMEAISITTPVGIVIASFIGLLSIPAIIAGVGLLKRQFWARILALIIACLDLFNFPIGTAIGIYALWTLLQDETVQILSGDVKEVKKAKTSK